ncbi:MAG: hypothetical protein RL417_2042, partial [Pseudomonadota bacterium]
LRREARERLGEFNLTPNAGDPASSLSGGQLRLLEIARTLAGGAALLLLDEPTAGVSPRMREGIIDGIKRVQAAGKTVLIIEHDITFIERFCSRILVLNEGRIELDGTPEAIRADERLQSIYFGRAPTPGR